jgi:hypothetical protein
MPHDDDHYKEPPFEPSREDWEWLNNEVINQGRRDDEGCCQRLNSRLDAKGEERDGSSEFPGVIPLAFARFLANGNTHV